MLTFKNPKHGQLFRGRLFRGALPQSRLPCLKAALRRARS